MGVARKVQRGAGTGIRAHRGDAVHARMCVYGVWGSANACKPRPSRT